MTGPLWSILIATLESRQVMFAALVDELLRQIDESGAAVEVVAYPNTGGRPLGEFSQALLMDARGEYVSFVDDDDWVMPDFVSAVSDRMLSGPDIVGFENEYSENGMPHPNTFILRHSYGMNGCKAPPGVNPARCRDITHVTPIKTVLAQRGDFRSGWPSDYHWAQGVRPYVQTEEFIPRALYSYRFRAGDSEQMGTFSRAAAPRLVIAHPAFRYYQER